MMKDLLKSGVLNTNLFGKAFQCLAEHFEYPANAVLKIDSGPKMDCCTYQSRKDYKSEPSIPFYFYLSLRVKFSNFIT